MPKKELKEKIKEILNASEYWQPKMIIEEKEPFFWRLNPDWVKEKTAEILEVVEEGRQKKIGKVLKWAENKKSSEIKLERLRREIKAGKQRPKESAKKEEITICYEDKCVCLTKKEWLEIGWKKVQKSNLGEKN